MRAVLIVLCLVGFRGVGLIGQSQAEWAKVRDRIQPINLYPIYAGQCENFDQYIRVIDEEFDQDSLDKWFWKPTYGDVHHTKGGDQTREYNYDTSLHFNSMDNGTMQIEITNNPIYRKGDPFLPDGEIFVDLLPNLRNWPYRSGAITSKLGFSHGRYSIRCKIPPGKFMWPAFWLYGACGNEIDIFEFQNNNNDQLHDKRISLSVHNEHQCDGIITHDTESYNQSNSMANSMHIYDVTWNDFIIQFKVDGVVKRTLYHYYQRFNFFGGGLIHQYVPVVFCQLILPGGVYYEDPQFTEKMVGIYINAAVRKNAPASAFPQTMDVDYFRLSEPINCNSTLLINDISDIYGYRPFTVDGDRTYNAGTITVAPTGVIPLVENPNFNGPGDLLILTATNEITIKPGLEVHANGNLVAQIKPCGSNKQLEPDEMLPEVSDPESFYVMNGEVVGEATVQDYLMNQSEIERLIIYPNPATDQVTINATEPGDEIFITDVFGRIRNSNLVISNDLQIIDIDNLESGIYFLQIIRLGKNIFVEKIVNPYLFQYSQFMP
jgi:Glycosyl hydrolases family 16/Secretion system C-terminal sorting domain